MPKTTIKKSAPKEKKEEVKKEELEAIKVMPILNIEEDDDLYDEDDLEDYEHEH